MSTSTHDSTTAQTESPYGRSPAQAARRLGTGRNGKPLHPSTFTRWILQGVRLSDGSRLTLRARRLPGGWRITDDDLDAFIDATTRDRLDGPELARMPLKPASRRRESERVGHALDAVGIA